MKQKRLFAGILFALVVLSSLLVIVSAADLPFKAQGTVTIGEQIKEAISKVTKNADAGSFISKLAGSQTFVHILVFLLVALILYAVIPWIPFLGDNTFVSIAISIIAAILATLYLNPTEIAGVLYPYKALGLVLVGILPFCAVVVISKKLHEKNYAFLSKLFWIAFAVVLGAVLLSAPVSGENAWVGWVYIIIFALSILMIFIENWVWFRIFKMTLKGEASASQMSLIANLTADLERNRASQRDADPETLRRLKIEEKDILWKIRKSA